MQFSGREMAALLKAAKLMAMADGAMTDDEKDVIKADLSSFGITIDSLQSIALEQQANAMEGTEVIKILSKLTNEQKKYACGYLAAVMGADGEIHEKEKELWTLLSLFAGFPIMSFSDAISFWQTH